MITAISAVFVSDSQAGPSIPIVFSVELNSPLSGSYSQNQTNPIATTLVTTGE